MKLNQGTADAENPQLQIRDEHEATAIGEIDGSIEKK